MYFRNCIILTILCCANLSLTGCFLFKDNPPKIWPALPDEITIGLNETSTINLYEHERDDCDSGAELFWTLIGPDSNAFDAVINQQEQLYLTSFGFPGGATIKLILSDSANQTVSQEINILVEGTSDPVEGEGETEGEIEEGEPVEGEPVEGELSEGEDIIIGNEGEGENSDYSKQVVHTFDFFNNTGDMRYYSYLMTDYGLISGGPSRFVSNKPGAIQMLTRTVDGATSYIGIWTSANETAASRDLLLNVMAALPWPIAPEFQFSLDRWYILAQGTGDWKVEFKTGPRDDETLLKQWTINDFSQPNLIQVSGTIPQDLEPFKLMNIVAETNTDLTISEVGFYVKTPSLSDLRYAFLVSAAQVFRCYGLDEESGQYLVRDRSNWPLGDFDSVPGSGFASLVAAVASDLGMVKLPDAQTLVKNCVAYLLTAPAHSSNFRAHWSENKDGQVIRHPDSEISTVDTALAFLSSYLACAILNLETEREQLLEAIKALDFSAVTTAQNEISMGFDVTNTLIPYNWNIWGGETQLVLLLAKLNDPTKSYTRMLTPPVAPDPPVPGGAAFIVEIAALLCSQFGGESVGPDSYGVDWYQVRQDYRTASQTALPEISDITGQSAVEILSAIGNATYHVGGINPLNTGNYDFGSPWGAPHYLPMSATLDLDAAIAGVQSLRQLSLMGPLSGPAEAVLFNQTDWSVARVNPLQGVLNGFFSAIGYYHAVVADEGLTDAIYRINREDPELSLALNALFNEVPEFLSLQAETGTGDGSIMQRSGAEDGKSVLLFPGKTRQLTYQSTGAWQTSLSVRYSNDNYGATEQLDLSIDGVAFGSHISQDTGNYGSGWNVFVSSETYGPITLPAGNHIVNVSVLDGRGDGYGIEIDSVALQFSAL